MPPLNLPARTLMTSKTQTACVATLAAALISTPVWGQALFQDSFESNTSANYELRVGYYSGTSTNDYTLDWSFDYANQTFNRFASQTAAPETLPVPPAPNSAPGTSKSLKITVNKNDNEPGRFEIGRAHV